MCYTVPKGYTRHYTENRARRSPKLVGGQFVDAQSQCNNNDVRQGSDVQQFV